MGFVHVASIMMFIIVLSHVPGNMSSSSNEYLHGRDYNTDTTHQEPSHTARKLLFQESSCTSKDLSISQNLLPIHGIPVYTVEIVNTCESQYSRCAPSDIHLHCGQFASARLVNPRLFKRLSYDDCLVNNGQKLRTGQVISFSYSNTFKYPISFKHATFC
ncbi:TPD1 protein homolog 1-like [Bidens hawaiensis]|uniref:TPD1 protein homolog 1-like n=1 Tax=Bidens hawaiensis TaxID=980011 RepID=UPI00404A9678